MEPEPQFMMNLVITIVLLTAMVIPINGMVRRRTLERRRQQEEELQSETLRYVTELQQARERDTQKLRGEWEA